jgi:hypothetical protein
MRAREAVSCEGRESREGREEAKSAKGQYAPQASFARGYAEQSDRANKLGGFAITFACSRPSLLRGLRENPSNHFQSVRILAS